MSTQTQVTTACAALTLAQARTWALTPAPEARDAYCATLMTNAGITPIDEYAVTACRNALRNLLPTA